MIRTSDKLVAKYIEHCLKSGRSYASVARSARIVIEMLASMPKFNRREFKLFYYRNVGTGTWETAGPVIEDFAAFAFGSGKPFVTVERVRALEKLNNTTERNSQEISNFMAWLKEQYDYSINTLMIYRFSIKDFFTYSLDFNTEAVKGYLQALKERGSSRAP